MNSAVDILGEVKYYHEIVQCEEEWKQLRSGKVTGSKAGLLLVNGTKKMLENKFVARMYDETGLILSAGLLAYVYQKAGEVIADEYDKEDIKSYAMDRGNYLEAIAVMEYEKKRYPVMVENCGFISRGEYVGYSPDGLIGEDGILECKCLMTEKHVRALMEGIPFEKAYFAQMQFGFFVTGRKWCDYIQYHPKFKHEKLLEKRVYPDEEIQQIFKEKTVLFAAALNAVTSQFYGEPETEKINDLFDQNDKIHSSY